MTFNTPREAAVAQPEIRATETPAAASPHPARVVHSVDILQGSKVVDIQHNGTVYRLQATKLGKLILTK